ncbi:MAG: phosphotransferase [Candidatus Woesebacteria bacterium]
MSAENRIDQISQLPQDQLQRIFIPLLKEVTDINAQITVKLVEKIGQGQYSFGFKVIIEILGQDYPFFIKTERDKDMDESGLDIARRMDIIKSSRPRDGIVKSYGTFGLMKDSVIRVTEETVTSSQLQNLDLILAIQDLLDPAEYTQMLSFLGQLGLSTIQSAENLGQTEVTTQAIRSLYEEVTKKMILVHDAPLSPAIKGRARELYQNGISHVIEDSTRLNGLAALMPQFSQGTIDAERVDLLKQKMMELAVRYAQDARERLAPIHGDFWSANIFVSTLKTENRVEIIDPASVGFGDPGYDVVFANADLAFLDANRSRGVTLSGEYSQMADEFVERYAGDANDRHIRKYMALFYGYKAFVSALFDAGDNQEQRRKLFDSALGVVELALADPEFEFSFKRLDAYALAGEQLRT